jgi:hypothetical protein
MLVGQGFPEWTPNRLLNDGPSGLLGILAEVVTKINSSTRPEARATGRAHQHHDHAKPRVGSIQKNVLLMPPQFRELERAHFDGITPGRPDAIKIKPCLG